MSHIRQLVRVVFIDETAWGEHIENNLYRCLNHTLSNVECKLPSEHEHADKNGTPVNLQWGHIFEGKVIGEGRVEPLFIVGYDDSPRKE